MRDRLFKGLASLVSKRPGLVLLVCAIVTVVMVIASSRITLKTQIADMMPKSVPMAQEFQNIIDEFQSASSIMIAVESAGKDTKRMKECADHIAQKLNSIVIFRPSEEQDLSLWKKMQLLSGKYPVEGVVYDTVELVKRIDYKLDKKFISQHGLMMRKPKDLKNTIDMFGSLKLPSLVENINDNFEKEFIEDSDNMATLDGESEAVQGLESMYRFIESIGKYIDTKDTSKVAEAIGSFISGPDYVISPDNTLLLVMLQPTVDMDDFEESMALGYQVVDSLEVVQKEFPDLEVGGTGWMLIQIDEMEASKKDFGWPSVIALALILLLLIGSFRTWRNPFFSVATLIIAIIWTAGFLGLVMRYLDMMSAAFAIILIGLGIDFGIHFISGFRDGREKGMNVADAIYHMYDRVGSGVFTGGMTTAIVFFSLSLTGFKAFTTMGVAIGSGIVITMIAAGVLLPALIVWDNKGYSVIGNSFRKIHLGFVPVAFNTIAGTIGKFFALPFFNWITAFFQFTYLESVGRMLTNLPVAIAVLLTGTVLMVLSVKAGRDIEFEYNMMELEPIGIPTAIVQDKILEKFEMAPDYAMLRVDNIDDCRDKIEQLKEVGNRTGVIGGVDGITEYIPVTEDQKENRPVVEQFRKKVRAMSIPQTVTGSQIDKLHKELIRLHQNIVEIGELSIMGSGLQNKIVAKCDQIVGKKDEDSKILALAQKVKSLSDSPTVLTPYQKIMAVILQARLVAMSSTDPITPATLPTSITERYVSPKTGEMLITVYAKSNIWDEKILRRFTEETSKVSERITGTPPMMLLFMDLLKEKGKTAIIIGAIAILAFLMLDFRSIKYTLLAIVPLIAGAVWMVGFMALFSMKFNFVNFMCLPLILGIGIDDGVHVLHRYAKEGKHSLPVVMRYTGRAILLTSLTTMIGFGSMGLASHRGTASMGQVLFLGVGACFVSSVFMLGSLITILERLSGKKAKADSRLQ